MSLVIIMYFLLVCLTVPTLSLQHIYIISHNAPVSINGNIYRESIGSKWFAFPLSPSSYVHPDIFQYNPVILPGTWVYSSSQSDLSSCKPSVLENAHYYAIKGDIVHLVATLNDNDKISTITLGTTIRRRIGSFSIYTTWLVPNTGWHGASLSLPSMKTTC